MALIVLLLTYADVEWLAAAEEATTKAATAKVDSAGIEFFEQRIRPVLVKHCYKCHSAKALAAGKLKGKLRLDSRAGIRKGGANGPAVVPGNVADSLLIVALKHEDEDLEMPPKTKLPDDVIAHFVKWIERGAPDPRDGRVTTIQRAINIEKARAFWAFQPLKKAAPPAVKDAQWPRSEIDRFVLARLERAGIRPSADALRVTLIRRLYFDLVGLPPTPAEVDAFIADPSPKAVGAVVDKLLASRRFGERWGRHWLDVARFAESSGGGRSLMFKNAWRYRDYVIAAYNSDKPFDRFVREQLAGDLLPSESPAQRAAQLIASGFLVLGPTNYELQDKQQLRMDVIDEQIDTIGRALLGLTLGCARCHDHKFDPVPTANYYALAGILGSTEVVTPGNVSGYVEQPLPPTDSERVALEKHTRQVAELTDRLVVARRRLKLLGPQPASAKQAVKAKSRKAKDWSGIVIDNTQARLTGKWKNSTVVPFFIGADYLHDEGQPKGANTAVFEPKITTGGMFEVRISYTAGGNRASNTRVLIDHQDGQATVTVNQSQTPPLVNLFYSVGQYRFEADSRSAVTISNSGSDGVVIVDAVQFLPLAELAKEQRRGPPPKAATQQPVPNAKQKSAALSKANREVQRLDKQIRNLKKKKLKISRVAMSVRDLPKAKDEPIHILGLARNLGPVVPRGYLAIATPPDMTAPSIPKAQSGRRQLADWIVDPRNPLTARVYVNRVWHHLFGSGIVRTPDNFGRMGERPSHPELLDYLARQFIADGWSTKSLIRRIVLSRVYGQGTMPSAGARKADPENRLLGRANRRRLDAEAIRDSILSVSGQLDLTAGGRTIKKISQYDLDYQFGEVRCRSVYVPRFRNSQLGIFRVFDAANPNLVMGRRNVTILPTQSLYLMNSQFVAKQAEHAARRLLAVDGIDEIDEIGRVNLAFRWALGRPATSNEIRQTTKFLKTPDGEASQLDAWRGVFQMLFACLDFRYLN